METIKGGQCGVSNDRGKPRLCWPLTMTTFKLPFHSAVSRHRLLCLTQWQGRPVKLDATPVMLILDCLFQASLSVGQLTY